MKSAFLLLTAGVLTAAAANAQSYIPEYGNKEMKVRPAIPIRAYPFSIRDVHLSAGPFKQAMEMDKQYLLVVEPDRLLSDYRAQAGLIPRAERYGGWEATRYRGPALGFYLSACAMAYAESGDARFLAKVNYIVDELSACQTARKQRPAPGGFDMSGYIGAIPHEDTLWSQVAAGSIRSHGFDLNGGASPWYVVHKVMAGLLDAYYYCNNNQALAVEKGIANWTETVIGHLPDSTLQRMLLCEYGGMNEVLANTYAVTGDKRYLDLSYKFHDKRILDSLSMGLDDLAGKHANTQVAKIIGCARRFELTAGETDRQIATAYWSIVTRDHSYATGGNSDYEYLGAARQLNDELTDATTETCVTYNMLKLTRHLFAWKPAAALMDYYEKALYNHILASQDHDDGMMCYYVSLRMGGHKVYSDRFNTFTCCVGTGMENHVKYGESIYSRGSDGSLFVNLFIPSRLTWHEKDLSIEQQTSLPVNDRTTLTIATPKPATFTLRIRKPRWSGPVRLLINGVAQNAATGADGYLFIRRTWKNNDKVELHFPESLYTEALPDNPDRIALLYGPVLLAGELGDNEPDPIKGIPVLVSSGKDPNLWLRRKTGDRLIFQTAGVARPADITLIPFHETSKEYYSVYWDIFTPETWTSQQEKYAADRKRDHDLETHTIDALRVNEMQPERDHSFTGDSLRAGEDHGKKWRSAENGGYFTFVLKVDSAAANTLVCSYWGDEYHERERFFDIQVDGRTIATQDMNPFRQSKFYELRYPVPQEFIKGKQQVTIKFIARSRRAGVGPVAGTIRMVRAE